MDNIDSVPVTEEGVIVSDSGLSARDQATLDSWLKEDGVAPESSEATDMALPAAEPFEYRLGNLREDGGDYTEADIEADAAIRGWMGDAELPAGTGTFLATEAKKLIPQLQAMNAAQRDLFQRAERAKLQRTFGDGYKENLNAARSLVQEIEAKRPGIVDFLERSGLGDSSVVIGLLASHGHTRARGY